MPETSIPSARDTVTEADVRKLASIAALPLSQDRLSAVTAILAAWLPEAAALSEKMSARRYQTLVPAIVFNHPGANEDEA